jgi:hypothetical protein
MRHKKLSMSDAESDALMLKRHPRGMLLEELGEAALETIRAMTPDQKAIFRARLNRSLGLVKTSGGRPS